MLIFLLEVKNLPEILINLIISNQPVTEKVSTFVKTSLTAALHIDVGLGKSGPSGIEMLSSCTLDR